jgi:cytochrome o ubiquinol oxidase subunit 2
MSANYSGAGFSDMVFKVEAVAPDSFAQWAATTRSAGPVLDAKAYAALVKPSKAVAPFTYRSVANGLFADIQSTAMQSATGLCVAYPKSMRAER